MAERLYGWSEAKTLKMNIRNLVPECHKQEQLAKLKKLIHAEALEPYRTKRLAKDDRIVEVWLTTTSVVNEVVEVYAVATTEHEIQS